MSARNRNLVFLFLEVEDVYPVSARIGHDDASAGIGGDAVGTDQSVEVRLAGYEVEHLLPEAALGFDLARGVEATLVGKLAAAQQLHLRRRGLRGDWLFFFRSRYPGCQ